MRASFSTPTRRQLIGAGISVAFLPVLTGAGKRSLRISLLGQSLIKTDLRAIGWTGLAEFKQLLDGRDAVFTDLETVIAGPLAGKSTRPADSEVLHVGEPSVIDCLQAIGVNLVATSNNHAWDLDTGGILSTIDALRSRRLTFAGTGANLAEASAPAALNGSNAFALVSAAAGAIRDGAAATDSRPGVNELRRAPDGALVTLDVERYDLERTVACIAKDAGHPDPDGFSRRWMRRYNVDGRNPWKVAAEGGDDFHALDKRVRAIFDMSRNQPAGDLGGRPLVTGSPQPHSIETRVIGMRVAVHLSGSDTALLAGQTLLAVIDTLFATVIGLRIGAFVERFDIDLVESDVATAPSVDFDGNKMRAKLHWPAGSTPADHLGESGTHSQFLLLSTLMLVATSLADRQKISLEKLFREESLLERVSAAVASSNSRIRAMNSPASRLTDWNELSLERFPPKADRPVIVRVPEADPEEETISERYATGDHRSVEVRSILDIPQWEQARWIGVMLGLQHDLPIVGLHFEDREAGRQIFERWRERFGARDAEGAIHIAILRELPGRPPSHYAVLLMAGTEPGDFAGTLVSMPSRLKLLEPAADTNLRFFLDNYPAGGSFILVPTYVKENGEPDLMMDLAILKHDLSIRRVADIGKSDLEIIGVQLLEQMEARDGSLP